MRSGTRAVPAAHRMAARPSRQKAFGLRCVSHLSEPSESRLDAGQRLQPDVVQDRAPAVCPVMSLEGAADIVGADLSHSLRLAFQIGENVRNVSAVVRE